MRTCRCPRPLKTVRESETAHGLRDLSSSPGEPEEVSVEWRTSHSPGLMCGISTSSAAVDGNGGVLIMLGVLLLGSVHVQPEHTLIM